MILKIAFVLWFAQSGLEYKIVKSNPKIAHHFHGVKGMIISGIISAIVTLAVGSATGTVGTTAAMIAGAAGLFTNNFTYAMFTWIEKTWHRIKEIKASKRWREAWLTFLAGLKVIAGIFLLIVWTFGLPLRLYEKIKGSRATS